MVGKNENKKIVCSAVLLGVSPFLGNTCAFCNAGGGPGFSIDKDELKLNFKIAKLVLIKAEDIKPGDILMDDVDGHYLEKVENGDYGYRRYETLNEVIERLPKDEYENIKAKFGTNEYAGVTINESYFEQERKEVNELSRRRKLIWVPAEKIMKLVKIEKVTKEVLKDIEKNIECGNRNEIYVTEDGKYKLECV